MAVELDHVFFCTARDGPEADLLVTFGLVEGASNTHPGLGTANRRFLCRGRRQPLHHPKGIAEITGLRIALPGSAPISPALRALRRSGPVSLARVRTSGRHRRCAFAGKKLLTEERRVPMSSARDTTSPGAIHRGT